MRIHPIIPFYLVIIFMAISIGLLIYCLAKKKLRIKRNIRRISMLLLMCLVLLRPVFVNGRASNETNNLNIFFVVDATYSMVTKDVEGNERYRKLAKDIHDIVKAVPGSKYSVIVEDSAVYTAVPMSSSTDFVSSIWNENNLNNSGKGLVEPKPMKYSTGTNLNELLTTASEKITYYKKKNPNRNNFVIFMSDGEDYSDGISKHKVLRDALDGGAVFGYGSVNGAKIPTYSDVIKYVQYQGNDSSVDRVKCSPGDYFELCVNSKIHEENLKKIADNLGIQYYHRENGDVPSEVISAIKAKENFKNENEISNSYVDIYWVFSMIILGLLLWDFREVLDNVMREREYKNA